MRRSDLCRPPGSVQLEMQRVLPVLEVAEQLVEVGVIVVIDPICSCHLVLPVLDDLLHRRKSFLYMFTPAKLLHLGKLGVGQEI